MICLFENFGKFHERPTGGNDKLMGKCLEEIQDYFLELGLRMIQVTERLLAKNQDKQEGISARQIGQLNMQQGGLVACSPTCEKLTDQVEIANQMC